MAKLKILSPANSMGGVRTLARAGTDEIYIGLDEPVAGAFNFSGRFTSIAAGTVQQVNPNEQELRDVVQFAHDHGVQVNFASNSYWMMDDPDGGTKFRDLFLAYAEKGVKAGVDALIVGDVTNILALRERGVEIELHGSSFLTCWNVGFIRFLKEIGCRRVCFPYQMTLADYEMLTREEGMDYEFFGQFACSNIVGQCRMVHSLGPDLPVPLPCRNRYSLEGGMASEAPIPFLDSGQTCAICALPDLMKLNLHVIKTTGRDLNPQLVAMVTLMYRKCIDAVAEGASREDLLKIVAATPSWKGLFCNEGRCEYRGLPVERSYL